MRLGIDIGGTKTEVVAVAQGRILHQTTVPTGYGATAVVASVVEAAEEVRSRCGRAFGSFESIGAGIPGHVDHVSGMVSHAVNLGFETLDLGALLSRRLGAAVTMENDVNAAALGAHQWWSTTAGAREPLFAYLNLGTGLAAGLVREGSIWRGSNGVAGEIGHISLRPDGILCACGQRGCLETLASGSAIARLWPTDDPLPAAALSSAAATGDPEAVRILAGVHDGAATAIQILALGAGAGSVVIGGGLTALGPQLLAGIRKSLKRSAEASKFVASLALADRTSFLPDGFPAAAVGAALIGAGYSVAAEGGTSADSADGAAGDPDAIDLVSGYP
ncbi:glucokinase [Arthrobacter sp. UYP6]|uniref:ROK family protein n=1 Tax=Arthrobacter sp. UYP6 TaxID=1756378 RepID=UPI0033996344